MNLQPFAAGDTSRAARLFWALPAGGQAMRAGLFVRDQLSGGDGAAPVLPARHLRWLDPADWHVTLVFLGNVDVATGLASAQALAPVVAALAGFPVSLAGPAWFPSLGHPLVVALEAEISPPLRALASACGEAVRDAGLPHEARPFRGHMSLARVRRGARPRDALPRLDDASATMPVREIVLYESVKGDAGSRYVPRLALPLRSA